MPLQCYNNTWTLNTDDLNFGVHVVEIQGCVQSQTLGPTNSSGLPVYIFLGCYLDNARTGRLLPQLEYDNNRNTNGICQTDCLAGDYIFARTEYVSFCIPTSTVLKR